MADKSRTVTLKDTHLWKGVHYGPGTVEVPADFPTALKGLDADENGVAGDVQMSGARAGFKPRTADGDDAGEDVRDLALDERSDAASEARSASLDAAARRTVDAGVASETGDRAGAAVTGLHTVTHPEQGHGDPRTFRETNPPGQTPTAGVRTANPRGEPQTNAPGMRGALLEQPQSPDGGRTVAAPKGPTKFSREALSDMNRADLKALADERGITVTRKDGDGEPVKADYIDALASE